MYTYEEGLTEYCNGCYFPVYDWVKKCSECQLPYHEECVDNATKIYQCCTSSSECSTPSTPVENTQSESEEGSIDSESEEERTDSESEEEKTDSESEEERTDSESEEDSEKACKDMQQSVELALSQMKDLLNLQGNTVEEHTVSIAQIKQKIKEIAETVQVLSHAVCTTVKYVRKKK